MLVGALAAAAAPSPPAPSKVAAMLKHTEQLFQSLS